MDPQYTQVAPPPPDYYVLKGGQIIGPFNIEELRVALTEGQITPSDFVQTAGIPMWRPVSRILGGSGSVSPEPVAPEWKSILTWAWLRLRSNLEEQSLSTGLVFFGIGAVTLLLSRFSFLMWLPWFIVAAAAATALIRRRQAVLGAVLLVCICVAPIVVVVGRRHHSGSQGESRIASTEDKQASVPTSERPLSPSVEEGRPTNRSSTPPPLLVAEEPPAVPKLEPEPLTRKEPPPSVAPKPVMAAASPTPTPPPLVSAATPAQAPAVRPAASAPLVGVQNANTPSAATMAPPPLPNSPAATPTTAKASNAPAAGGGELVQRHRDSLVVVKDRDSSGSGFLCRKGEKTWLFTNSHVTAGMRQPTFSRLDGSRVTVGPAEAAAGYDAMRFSVTDSATNPLESVTDLEGVAKIGDEVIVLGNSGGGGVVTSLKGEVVGIGPDRIEVSAEFIPGNSGSPIIHVRSGKVIAIATYLTRRYEEFSAGSVVTRRFGFRLDNVPRWEAVNWQVFQSEAEQLRQISAVTEDVFGFLDSLRQRGTPSFGTDTLRRPAQQWLDTIRKPRLSEVDRLNATQSFLHSLRHMVRADVASAESRFRYSYFRERLGEERTVRDRLYKAFDSEARRVASLSGL